MAKLPAASAFLPLSAPTRRRAILPDVWHEPARHEQKTPAQSLRESHSHPKLTRMNRVFGVDGEHRRINRTCEQPTRIVSAGNAPQDPSNERRSNRDAEHD